MSVRLSSVIEPDALDDPDEPERPVPEVDVDPEEYDGLDDAPEGHRLVTAGLASYVYDEDREVLGHVGMFDLDDVEPIEALTEAFGLGETAVLLRSSAGNFHLVGLDVAGWDERVEDARGVSCAEDYLDGMASRGRFVMRTHPKIVVGTGETYKPAPEPIAVVTGEGPVSSPHATRFRQLAEDVGRDEVAEAIAEIADDAGRVGCTLTQSKYETVTDELREVVGPAGGDSRGE